MNGSPFVKVGQFNRDSGSLLGSSAKTRLLNDLLNLK